MIEWLHRRTPLLGNQSPASAVWLYAVFLRPAAKLLAALGKEESPPS